MRRFPSEIGLASEYIRVESKRMHLLFGAAKLVPGRNSEDLRNAGKGERGEKTEWKNMAIVKRLLRRLSWYFFEWRSLQLRKFIRAWISQVPDGLESGKQWKNDECIGLCGGLMNCERRRAKGRDGQSCKRVIEFLSSVLRSRNRELSSCSLNQPPFSSSLFYFLYSFNSHFYNSFARFLEQYY